MKEQATLGTRGCICAPAGEDEGKRGYGCHGLTVFGKPYLPNNPRARLALRVKPWHPIYLPFSPLPTPHCPLPSLAHTLSPCSSPNRGLAI